MQGNNNEYTNEILNALFCLYAALPIRCEIFEIYLASYLFSSSKQLLAIDCLSLF